MNTQHLANVARWYADALDKNDADSAGYYAYRLGITDCPFENHEMIVQFWAGHASCEQATLDARSLITAVPS